MFTGIFIVNTKNRGMQMKKILRAWLFIIIGITLMGCNPTSITCEEGFSSVDGTCQAIEDEYENSPNYYLLDHNGVERKYLLYIPEGITANAPIVFVLHGLYGDAKTMRAYAMMDDVADEHKFAVVYPLGLEVMGVTHWNANLDFSTVDDTGYILALAEYLHNKFDLSETNVFISGFSNGGYMGYTLACEESDSFRAIASVSGSMSKATWETCDTSQPVSILQIHGTRDKSVNIEGTTESNGGFGGVPGITEIVEYWKDVNNLTVETITIESDATISYKYTSESNDSLVWYYEITSYGHAWPGIYDVYQKVNSGINASEIIWEFFSNFIDN